MVSSTHGRALLIVGWFGLGISFGVVALRLYARFKKVRIIRADDYVMVIAWVNTLPQMIILSLSYTYGLGAHIDTLSQYNVSQALKYSFISTAFSILPGTLARLSFAMLLLRIIVPGDYAKKYTIWIASVIQLLINAATMIQIYAQCGPDIAANWDQAVKAHATCQPPIVQTVLGAAQSAFNSTCDLLFATIPALIIWSLHVARREKVILACTLMFWMIAFAASMLKAVQTRNLNLRDSDFTYHLVQFQIFICVENYAVIICASVPGLRGLLSRKTGRGSSGEAGSDSYRMDNLSSSQGRSTIDAKPSYPTQRERREQDNLSEERILGRHADPWPNAEITRTVEVRCSFAKGHRRWMESKDRLRRKAVPSFLQETWFEPGSRPVSEEGSEVRGDGFQPAGLV